MTAEINATTWVYVLVKNPGANEQIVGQNDVKMNITFIPAFTDKDSAQQAILHIPKEIGHPYEIQAIIYEDLERYAAMVPALIFFLSADGNIIEKRTPGPNVS